MNKSLLPLALSVASWCALASSAKASSVIYTEDFANPTGANQNFDYSGWAAYLGAAATHTTSVSDAVVSNAVGQGGANGYGAKISGTSGVGLYWTTEIGSVNQSLLEQFTFYSNNTVTTDALRIAIRLDNGTPGIFTDDLWFATDFGAIRNSATAGSGSNWNTNAELETFAFTTAAADWRDLTFVPGVALSLATSARMLDLPAGNVNAVGIYGSNAADVNASSAGVVRFDTFKVSIVPEPGTVSALLGGLGVLLGFQRSRRR